MRILLDMQGAQSESRLRGIGRYTISLGQAIARNRGEHEVILALSSLFPRTIEPIRAAFDPYLPQTNIRVYSAPGPVNERLAGNESRREIGELIREVFLASLEPDIIHVSSLFEGYLDDALTSIGRLDQSIPVSATFYDLIPLLNPDQYLNPFPRYNKFFRRKLDYFRKASFYLAISDFARQEALRFLEVPETNIASITLAAASCFEPIMVSPEAAQELYDRLALTRPFILYTGGADERKNLMRLIQAFAILPPALRQSYQLLLCGQMSPGELTKLKGHAVSFGLRSDEILFSGYVSDQDLVLLYNLCKLFVFPSWHEGFGLPALEAMACGAPVIAANASSLPEVVGFELALFDPTNVGSIATKISQALIDETFNHQLKEHGLRQAKRFSWDRSAGLAIAGWEKYLQNRKGSNGLHHTSWSGVRDRQLFYYRSLIQEIGVLSTQGHHLKNDDLRQIANSIANNEQEAISFVRSAILPPRITWRIEGPFDSSYSLARVNRETARALAGLGHHVVLHSSEGPGDFAPREEFLLDHVDIDEMYRGSQEISQDSADVTSRNMFPPRVRDMQCRLNFLHAYGWEESAFPDDWVEAFNDSLQGMTLMSSQVAKIMLDNGVTVPLAVSGLGVDHWERVSAAPGFRLTARDFRFLHVSSCFPRKGVELLLEAYGRTFRSTDPVTLVIKTFPNPHNQLHSWLDQARRVSADFPDVRILEEDYSDGELKALYQQCHALVAPSRGEGFGLPLAEAMLSGLAVITTAWGGQLDFCSDETAWLVDYRFERARTHFALFDSVWAAPDVGQLGRAMREVYEASDADRSLRITAARRHLLEHFRWADVGQRMVDKARAWSQIPSAPNLCIGWITTWNVRCGIATYSRNLVGHIPATIKIFASYERALIAPDLGNVYRCWHREDPELRQLRKQIEEHRITTLVIQFNYGFFDLEVFGDFLCEQADRGLVIVIVLHATIDPAHAPHKTLSRLVPAFSRCHRLLVHSPGDLNRLKQVGLINNVALFPHGVPDLAIWTDSQGEKREYVTLASYGFFLPHKGLQQLIEAIALLNKQKIGVKLLLVNSEYPAYESKQCIEQSKTQVAQQKLEGVVRFCTDYLSEVDSMARLREADLIVFPYQQTSESSSAAVRFALASGRPVAVTPLPIFDDVAEIVLYLPGRTPEAIAEGILRFIRDQSASKGDMQEKKAMAEGWVKTHRFSHLGKRLHGILVALGNAQGSLQG